MPKYNVYYCRVEHTLYHFNNIEAKDEEEAEFLAEELYEEEEWDKAEVVHGEEFIHAIDVVKYDK